MIAKFKFGDIVSVNNNFVAVVVDIWDPKVCVNKQNYTVFLKDEHKAIVCGESELQLLKMNRSLYHD